MRKVIATILICVLVASCHPWFQSRFPWEEGPDPNQDPVLTTSSGRAYFPSDATWVPLLDDCMATGGSRRHCINTLPPDERAKLEDWRRNQSGAQ
ncbi:MAG: hypothetical protein GKR90_22455 [Pseudomonadales bacterium]|nr:hypothetical protein [Pseudomonadales bacterium]